MDELRELIGVEASLDTVNRALCVGVARSRAPVYGAHVINCSDESQRECARSFQREFVDQLLPDLKEELRTAFETRNLGARYEWGSLHVAEHHYALRAAEGAFKVIVIKVHGHVSVTPTPDGPRFGTMERYDTTSTACGALHALLSGARLPALDELRQAFREGGHDRVATLLDPQQVDPAHRHLGAALTNAVLQARRAVQDAQFRVPHSPTVYQVVPTVVLNKPGADGEMVCGYCTVDHRGDTVKMRYTGLGDDPARYRIAIRDGRVVVTE